MITVTPEAATHMRRMLEKKSWETYGLRFGIRDGGCSGFSYILEFQPEPTDADTVIEQHGVRVFVDPEHQVHVQGSVIAWKDEIMETGFDIRNPNAKRACGCGSSFDL